MIKLVIFDLSKTLTYKKYTKGNVCSLWKETGKKHSYRKFLKTYEKNFQLDKSKNFEKKYKKMLDELKIPYTDKLIKEYAKDRKRIESQRRLYSYSIPLLKELKQRKYKLGALSNKTYSHGSLILESKLRHYLDKFFFSYYIGCIKPDPNAFKTVLKYFKAKPSETLMIGDSYKDDIVPAKKLGLKAVIFKNGRQIRKELKRIGVL